ncbi:MULTISPECIES: aspartate aminotransferase family protein [unclassified Cellulophaga]|uniref:aspartate aminotransferase family protein n=1 Tax=unclassified Cellulophaga TaxID=2634405 RepID=UPI0026E36755|nr:MULTISPECIES: aspartate aminotransferase family protein [unclassified Cellulophaga]MDO6491996.1 aspartate aminotransferase family protein [Cellulophaga sp. 2_MG-2023]MDO6495844.1 aspartate aminotransferase family protein [Cellulophaga sp. 3_MG-2023]
MKKDFLHYQAQTSPHPLTLQVSRASGSYIYDQDNNAHLDFVAGVSACTLGHCHPKVVAAVTKQASEYMHVMVYGEYVQEPPVAYTKLLASLLPSNLETTYLVNSGTEAIEGALKLAKRATGRHKIVAARNSYHGNTMGSMSVSGAESQKSAYRPLVPGTTFINFNSDKDLEKITTDTAAVILETIQGGAGFIVPKNNFLQKVRARCTAVGSLLILDEIQPGFGRTGKLFAFEHYNCTPDILVIGKGMASGMPVGAFVASNKLMKNLQTQPKLGHITTFGGNPVIAAASLATLQELTTSNIINDTLEKEKLFKKLLKHEYIKEIHGKGLMLAVMLANADITNHVVMHCAKNRLILFWLLFEPKAVRISPPLTISNQEITLGCKLIIEALNSYKK